MSERACQPALADTGRPGDDQIIARGNPVTRDQLHEQCAVKTAGAAIVDVFGCRVVAQLGEAQAGGQLAVVPEAPFPVEQQRQPLGMGQAVETVEKGLREIGVVDGW